MVKVKICGTGVMDSVQALVTAIIAEGNHHAIPV